MRLCQATVCAERDGSVSTLMTSWVYGEKENEQENTQSSQTSNASSSQERNSARPHYPISPGGRGYKHYVSERTDEVIRFALGGTLRDLFIIRGEQR